MKNSSHTITTTIDLKGHEEGVIVSVGGMTGGFTMFIKSGRLYYDYNYLDGVYYTMASPPLPKGKTGLKFNFIKTREFGGIGELYINGKKLPKPICPKCISAPIHWRKPSTWASIPAPRSRNSTKVLSHSKERSTRSL